MGRKLMGWLPISLLYLVNIVYAMLVLINLMGCAWLFVAELEGSHISWLIDVGASSFPVPVSLLERQCGDIPQAPRR